MCGVYICICIQIAYFFVIQLLLWGQSRLCGEKEILNGTNLSFATGVTTKGWDSISGAYLIRIRLRGNHLLLWGEKDYPRMI